jgi:peptidoglycan/LPS O-acetylase OafA/YrhL
MASPLLKKFRRITYSTSYLPEIDGLRFLAVFMVVVLLHITHFIDDKFFNEQWVPNGYWKNFVMENGHGVSLFFVISGFILSLPFAKWRLDQQEKISLKRYYLRRLTRLEPPYLIALAIFFIGNVWIANKYEFGELLPHFFASAVYLHNFIYDSFSWILPISWSLEVEVQFYLLAPLFFLLFLIRSNIVRWLLFAAVIIFSAVFWFDVWNVVHVFVYLHYFFMGILLADLYCCKVNLIKNKLAGLIIGIIAFWGFIFLPSIHNLPGFLLKLVCMFLLVHATLNNPFIKKIFSLEPLIIIGGMCYSIYLLHYGIISAVGYAFRAMKVDVANYSLIPLFVAGFAALVLLTSALFFLLVEKPFMRFKKRKKLPAA